MPWVWSPTLQDKLLFDCKSAESSLSAMKQQIFILKSVSLKAFSVNIAKAFCENVNLIEKIIRTGKGWAHLSQSAFCSRGTWHSWRCLLFTSSQTSICNSRCWVVRGHSVQETWNQVRKLPGNQFPFNWLWVAGTAYNSLWTACPGKWL